MNWEPRHRTQFVVSLLSLTSQGLGSLGDSLRQWHSKCGPWATSSSSSWELNRTANPQDPPWGFPGGSDGKETASNEGDPSLIPRLVISLGEGNGNPLQYSCLENPMDKAAWQATVHGVAKSRTWLSDSHTHRTHQRPLSQKLQRWIQQSILEQARHPAGASNTQNGLHEVFSNLSNHPNHLRNLLKYSWATFPYLQNPESQGGNLCSGDQPDVGATGWHHSNSASDMVIS